MFGLLIRVNQEHSQSANATSWLEGANAALGVVSHEVDGPSGKSIR